MPESFFRIEMLPARHGDCLWVEYGKGGDLYRLLIDGGPVSTYEFVEKRMAQMPEGDKAFELIVLTHVDADHVEGLVRLFAERPLLFAVDQVWFNGWRQMKQSHGLLGAMQGEFLSALLARRVPQAWNADDQSWVVMNQGTLPCYPLDSGMKLTLLSPSPAKLQKMAKSWGAAVRKAGILPGDLDAAWRVLAQRKKFLPKKGLLGVAPNLDILLKKQFAIDVGITHIPSMNSCIFQLREMSYDAGESGFISMRIQGCTAWVAAMATSAVPPYDCGASD